MMNNRMLDNRVKKLHKIAHDIEVLEIQAEAIRKSLQEDLTERETDEYNTGNFIIRWKDVLTRRFDSKSFKAQMPDLYTTFCKESVSKRFTIA